MIKRKTESKKPRTAKRPKIEVTERPDYKVVYASGVFGGLDPHDSRIIFFLDRLKPKMKSGDKGAMELEKVERELQVEVHMSPHQFISVAKWMMGHAQSFGKKMKSKTAKDSGGTSYIG
jgi:hypothetical protein